MFEAGVATGCSMWFAVVSGCIEGLSGALVAALAWGPDALGANLLYLLSDVTSARQFYRFRCSLACAPKSSLQSIVIEST